jgi:eukaryotic-like serine/threonine-protein kinase
VEKHRSGDGAANVGAVSRSGPMATPAEQALAEAKTMMQPEPGKQTLLGSAKDVPPAPRGRATIYAFVALGALALGVVSVLALRKPEPVEPGQAMVSNAVPTAAPVGATSVATAATAVVAPAPVEQEIEIEVRSAPDKAEVYVGAERLGVVPGPFKVKRGTTPIKLTIKADGYKPQEIEITPDKNVAIPVPLTKIAAPAVRPNKGKSGAGDLENPF